MEKLKSVVSRILKSTVIIVLIVSSYFFGSSVLENSHLSYIRYLSKDVVTLMLLEGGGGTGFLIKAKSGKRFILTNSHICKAAKGKSLIAIYQDNFYIVPVIQSYQMNDLCIAEAPMLSSGGFRLAKSVVYGERVYAIGHPYLEPITVTQGELSGTITTTISIGLNVEEKDCSGPTYELRDLSHNPMTVFLGIMNNCIRILESNSSTVSFLPGNSGSPVVNIWGNVVGVAFASIPSGVHSYIVPLNDVKTFLNSL